MINKKYNKAFPVDNLSEIQQKLFGFDEFDHGKVKKVKSKNRCKSNYIQSQFDVRDYKDPEIIVSEEYQNKYYFDEDGVLSTLNPLCPNCHSRKVTQWGLYSKNVISEEYSGEIIIQRYHCKRCDKTFILDLDEHFDSHSSISNSLKHKACEIKELNWSSLRDIAKYYEIFYGIKISYETVRKSLIVVKGNEIDYNIPNLSGYYGYDAQWIKINKEWKFRHVVYDTVQRMPIAELFADEESNEDVKYLINKYIEPIKRIGIVTDTKKGYGDVMRDLKFTRHQYCTFHFKLNLNKKVRQQINEQKDKITKNLKDKYKDKSESFLEKQVEKELKPFRKEIRYALQFIYEIFKRGSISKAEAYVQLIKMNKKNFPDFIEKYLDKNFLPVYKSYIYHLDEQYKDKLDGTNNKTEGFFRATMPKGQKRKFRTLEGIINQIYHRGNGLIKNQKEKNKKNEKPNRRNVR